jgi:gliding motility-associated-like protein
MIKKILILATGIASLVSAGISVNAQVKHDIFNIPDTVCTDHEIEPYDIVEDGRTYNWSFCPPDLSAFPAGENVGVIPYFNNANQLKLVRENNRLVGFFLNSDGYFYRMRYEDGIKGNPSNFKELGKVAISGKGLDAVNDGNEWHLFVIGGNEWNNSNLMRLDFGNGVLQNPTEVVTFGNFDSLLAGSNQLVVAKDNDENWYGFTINKHSELIRLDFGTNIKSRPYIVNMGTMFGALVDVTDFELIKELNNWHLFVTNKGDSELKRISFGNSFLNPAYVINFGSLNGNVFRPAGLTITRECDKYYGWLLSEGNGNLMSLIWDNSIADTPRIENLGNFVGIRGGLTISNTLRENGGLYMLSTNFVDQSASRIEYNPCNYATPLFKDQRLPPTFKYTEPGWQTVSLTIDDGLPTVRSECQQIYVYPHTEISINTRDTTMCSNDTVRIHILNFDVDSILWSPNYNIDTTMGNSVKIWPNVNTKYHYTMYFDRNCVVRNPLDFNVSKIYADAGPDRYLNDGGTTSLGGPNTSVIDGYGYRWYPSIGITGSEWEPITTAVPPYNITYYLEVSNEYGCKALDSVHIVVPCTDPTLPNAFSPIGSSLSNGQLFKIMNAQYSKINSFKVYDRWGKVVFETTDINEGWDGYINGTPAQFGVYVWEVDAYCNNTLERKISTGNVTLVK